MSPASPENARPHPSLPPDRTRADSSLPPHRAGSHTLLPPARARLISLWFWCGALLVFAMVVIGGITRLTGSGLSMTDWNLIMGAFPPGSEADWEAAFDQYRQFPEYQLRNTGMSLEGFKAIFFWEYLHRMLGRFTGLAFLLPFLFFWMRGWFTPRLFRRALLLFGMGALQAGMGWFMVKSGLVDVPQVSHYRLAAHLMLAVILIGLCAWYAMDLRAGLHRRSPDAQIPDAQNPDASSKASPLSASATISSVTKADHSHLRRWSLAVAVLFLLQMTWGAFTAGLDAGLIYNTFPAMNGSWLPQNAAALQPLILNVVENPGTVQFVHRLLGTLLLGAVLALWRVTVTSGSSSESPAGPTHGPTPGSATSTAAKSAASSTSKSPAVLRTSAALLAGIILLQYLLGVFTLLYHVPVSLGVIHQAVALVFWIALLHYRHLLTRSQQSPSQTPLQQTSITS